MMTDKQDETSIEMEIRAVIDSRKEEIARRIQDDLASAVTAQFKWAVPDIVNKETKSFFEENIIPDLRKAMMDQKGPILQNVTSAATQIGALIAQKMVEEATKSLNGYRADDIIKKLMGGH